MVKSPRKKSALLLMPRRCKYCRATFVPERPQDKDAKFCCPNHRKNFWRYGGLPFDKMVIQLERKMRPPILNEARVAARDEARAAVRDEARAEARVEFAKLAAKLIAKLEKTKC